MLDTIFAPATALGRAGVGIVRISGPQAHEVGVRICGSLPAARVSAVRWIRDPRDGSKVDQALVLKFDENASFTGEPVVELHHHGSPAVVSQLIEVLSQQSGVRLAEPGEFTRRSLDNGCLDLSQVEGLADLIDSDTDSQRRQALRVMDGELSRLVTSWRADLLRSIALTEATIDFADEDVPVDVLPEVRALLSQVQNEMRHQLDGAKAAGHIRTGFEVAIIGRPNVGKSSLINKLSRRDVALISEIAGTTRDVIEVRLDVSGQLVTFLDTAGLRETNDVIEGLGIDLARKRAQASDLRLFLLEPGQSEPDDSVQRMSHDMVIHGKDDQGVLGGISSRTGAGIDALLETVGRKLGALADGSSLLIRERHLTAMRSGVGYIDIAMTSMAHDSFAIEIIAEDIRSAIVSLDKLVGHVGVEDVLGEIFSSFCIGK